MSVCTIPMHRRPIRRTVYTGDEFDALRSHVLPVRRADKSERLARRPLHGEDPHRVARPYRPSHRRRPHERDDHARLQHLADARPPPIPIIRNEELILLRAEARLATGDKAGAIADLNQVRVNSGGLPASTLTATSAMTRS